LLIFLGYDRAFALEWIGFINEKRGLMIVLGEEKDLMRRILLVYFGVLTKYRKSFIVSYLG